MGLISQIEKNSHVKKIETKNFERATDHEKISQPEESPSSRGEPAPCPICRSPIFWIDRYGGGPHCVICQPPPSKSLVARLREIATEDDGSFAWDDERATDGTTEGRYAGGESGGELHDFDQRYRFYTSRDGKREIIERRDWTFLNAMIVD